MTTRSLTLTIRTDSETGHMDRISQRSSFTETEVIALIEPSKTLHVHEMRHVVTQIERLVERLKHEGWIMDVEVQQTEEAHPLKVNEGDFFELLDNYEAMLGQLEQYVTLVDDGETMQNSLHGEREALRKVREAMDRQIGRLLTPHLTMSQPARPPEHEPAPSTAPPSEDPDLSF